MSNIVLNTSCYHIRSLTYKLYGWSCLFDVLLYLQELVYFFKLDIFILFVVMGLDVFCGIDVMYRQYMAN